ncbi:MAG: amino acid permease [Candidatus Marinimicrobia bacterium]|jgi:APA family basic amino acid/polyamine antiporter|nr:amino acid permease [Candidatus Neomarinimicrobiota bacterium]MBT4149307.1 amino acid permease [Candidatus Neomarinimicrobiota bacterium]MBT4318490.1 amino acid permease [Candidatus Neomarinimicrobiota bacterium]MBT7525441.1 amino acid permease [Candidatus Neomarinimicrobiota bacterium]
MTKLKKTLGLFDGIALLVGITIGAGIFKTPQVIASYINSFSIIIILWLSVAVFVYVGALIYAELGSRFPQTGGEYVYMQKAFGPFFGFLFGWAQLFIIRTSPTAALSLLSADYLGYFFPLDHSQKIIIASLIIIVFGIINILGVNKGSAYNKFSSSVKITGLMFFCLIGLILTSGDFSKLSESVSPTASLGPVGNLIAAIMMIVFSFLGWDRVGYVAGEMKNPKKVIPQSMFYGMLIVTMLYLGSNILYHSVIGLEGMRSSSIVASDTAISLFGNIGASLISIMVIISATGSVNGTMMATTRVYYAMAKDGLIFKWFDYIDPKFQTPTHAIIAHCIWSIALILIRQNFETLVAGMVFAILIFYGFTTVAFFKFRKEKIGNNDGYKLPYFPLLPSLYILGIIVLVFLRAFYEPWKSAQDLLFVLSGIPVYFIFFKK